MQVKSGTISVTNLVTTVKGLWTSPTDQNLFTASMSGLSGPLEPTGEVLTGLTTGATITYISDNGATLTYRDIAGTPGTEVFEGATSGNTVTLTNHVMTLFVDGEVVTFTPSGQTGKVAFFDPTTSELRFERTSAAGPSPNDDATGAGGAVARVTDPVSSTQWLSGQNGEPPVDFAGPYAALFNRRGIAASFEISNVLDEDELTLSAAYTGITEDDVPYRISQDFDAETGLILLSNGDVDAASLWNRNVSRIKQLLGNAIGLFTATPTFAGNAKKSTRVNVGETALELFTPAALNDENDFLDKVSLPTSADATVFKKHTVGNAIGGSFVMEPADILGGANLNVSFHQRFRITRDFVKELLWHHDTGKLTVDQLEVLEGLVGDIAASSLSRFLHDYQPVYDPWEYVAAGIAGGPFLIDEVVTFTSGAVGVVRKATSPHVIDLITGTIVDADTVTGQTSGATATVDTPIPNGIFSVTPTQLNYNHNPSWTANWFAGMLLEVLEDSVTPAAVGQQISIISNTTAGQIVHGGWVVQPSTSAVFRIVDPGEDRSVPRIPYGETREKLGGDQSGIISETEITGLSLGTTIPGADSHRKYKVQGVIQLRAGAGVGGSAIIRIRVGPLGTTSDPIVWESSENMPSTSDNDEYLPFPVFTHVQPDPDDKVTVSLQATQSTNVRGGGSAGRYSVLSIDEVQQRV